MKLLVWGAGFLMVSAIFQPGSPAYLVSACLVYGMGAALPWGFGTRQT